MNVFEMYRVSGHRARILDVSISDIFISVFFDRKYTAAHTILDGEVVLNSLQILVTLLNCIA